MAQPVWDGRLRVRVRPLRRVAFALFGAQVAIDNAWRFGFGLPAAFKWFDELTFVAFTAVLVLRVAHVGSVRRWKLAACWPLAAFTVAAAVSGLVNDVSMTEWLLGWRSLAQFLIAFLVLVWLEVDVSDIRTFFGAWMVAGFVHVPLGLLQLVHARAGHLGIDAVTGGFGPGTANLMGYFCGTAILVALCLGLIAKQYRYWLLAAPIAAIWPLTSANGSYIAFILVSILALLGSRDLRRFRHTIRYAAVGAIIFVAVGYAVTSRFHVSLRSMLLSPVQALTRHHIDDRGNPGRLALLMDTATLLARDDRTLLFGLGTGSVATQLGGAQPSNFRRFSEPSGTYSVFASVIGYFAELGVVGLLVILLIWAQAAWIVWRARRHWERRTDRAWLLAALLVVPFAVLAGGGEVTWTFQPVMYPVCALIALATVRVHRVPVVPRCG